MIGKLAKYSLLSACLFAAAATSANAQWWQQHPKYLHAMSDLRQAYWLIVHRDSMDPDANMEERRATDEIRRAYQNLKDASITDGKDIADQPPADMNYYDHRGRLHHALDLLHHAHEDVSGEEDDPAARGFRHKALKQIDKAAAATDDAINAWHF
jgi:hypothetical protein